MNTETQTADDDFLFVLKGAVGSSYSSDPRDIRLVKSALNRLGLYQPDPDIGIVEFTDAALFDGIKAF